MGLILAATSLAGPTAALHTRSPLQPVIVRETNGAGGAGERSVLRLGGEIGRRLGLINGFAARVPAPALVRLGSMPGIASVTHDSPLRPLHALDGFDAAVAPGSVYNTARQIGVKRYWNRGFTGRGVDVAVIDTGLSPVPGLTTSNKIVYGPDLSFESQVANLRNLDTYGHGTHMAGIIAGRDPGTYTLTENHDDFIGIAPGARIVSLKVANAMGATDVSQVIAAIDWVLANRQQNGLNIRVLNLSFGTDGVQDYTLDPLSYAVEQAWHHGIVVVVAAGNAGFGPGKLNNPAYNPYVIAVGASDTRASMSLHDDVVPAFSSTGDKQRNPDLVAPGRSIVSLRVKNSQLDLAHPEGRVNDRFFKGTGTSQAAAVVSGAAALVIEQRPAITPDQLKLLLTSTALPLPNADHAAQGNGMVHLGETFARPTEVDAGQTWTRSTGEGSLDAARGSLRVTDSNGVELSGEIDIFRRSFVVGPWDEDCSTETVETASVQLDGEINQTGPEASAEREPSAEAEATDEPSAEAEVTDEPTAEAEVTDEPTAEAEATEELADDTGATCETGAGNSWDPDPWAGSSWSDTAWTTWSEDCTINTWNGNSWSGNSWSGNSWSGNSWSGNSWSSHGWLGVSWGRKKR